MVVETNEYRVVDAVANVFSNLIGNFEKTLKNNSTKHQTQNLRTL